MRFKSCMAFFALLLFCRRIESMMCSRPQIATCSQDNSSSQTDIVNSVAVVNCCFEQGLCDYKQGCVDDGMERWNTTDGYAGFKTHSTVKNGYTILESSWVNVSAPSCVQFTYSIDTPYHLQAILAFHSGEQPCLMEDSIVNNVAKNQNRTARFSVESLIVKILFRVRGGWAGSTIPPPKLYYVRINEGHCDGKSTAAPAESRPTSEQCKHVFDTTTSSYSDVTYVNPSSVGAMTSPGLSTETMALDGDIGAGTIAGIIVIVVVVLIVVIIGIIVYRRKRHRSKSDDTEDQSPPAGGTNTENTATKRRGIQFSRRDGDYTDIDVATTPSSDINPYELADDGTNTNGSLHQNLQLPNGTKEDDYSRIDEAQPAAAHSRGKNTEQVKPNPNDVYSVVNKPGKKTPTLEYSLAKIVGDKPVLPNPNDVYSVVNKKGKKFEPAAKPGQPDTEYNTISHNGNSSRKAPGGATPDTYNRIGAVPSLGLNEKGRATTKPEDGLLTDDYNKLNLAGNGSVKEKSGAAGAAYDHVLNDPDDAYNKAGIGKRNVVIDSDYHRLKP